jgi:hypothetical protein
MNDPAGSRRWVPISPGRKDPITGVVLELADGAKWPREDSYIDTTPFSIPIRSLRSFKNNQGDINFYALTSDSYAAFDLLVRSRQSGKVARGKPRAADSERRQASPTLAHVLAQPQPR